MICFVDDFDMVFLYPEKKSVLATAFKRMFCLHVVV